MIILDVPYFNQYLFQEPATNVAEALMDFHHDLMFLLIFLIIFVSVTLFQVLAGQRHKDHTTSTLWYTVFEFKLNTFLLCLEYCYDEKSDLSEENMQESRDFLLREAFVDLATLFPKSAKNVNLWLTWNHNTFFEIFWTIIPMYILFIIGGPSFALLYSMEEGFRPGLTVKIIGHQWFWHYEFGDRLFTEKRIKKRFDSVYLPSFNMLYPGNASFRYEILYKEEPGFECRNYALRCLEVDRRLYLPKDTDIRLLTTSLDVIHSWTIPSFGIKIDACPGRLNQTNLFIKRGGTFYGQCSEICGINHGFMPIVVEVLDYNNWIQHMQRDFLEQALDFNFDKWWAFAFCQGDREAMEDLYIESMTKGIPNLVVDYIKYSWHDRESLKKRMADPDGYKEGLANSVGYLAGTDDYELVDVDD